MKIYFNQADKIMRFKKFYIFISIVFLTLQSLTAVAQSPAELCNENTYINSSDPNTIEYDNMISVYHATLIKEVSGKVKIWGDHASPDGNTPILEPTEVNSANGYNYQGSILKLAAGSRSWYGQFVILTTEGLYSWGVLQNLLHNDLTSSSASFRKVNPTATANVAGTNAYSLPMGVEPLDVKMMFGSHETLAIVTHSEDTYVLTFNSLQYGDDYTGSNGNKIWHQVNVSNNSNGSSNNGKLRKIVAVRGNSHAFMALTNKGKVYTWGENTYLGDGSARANRKFATEMTLPSGVTPKMIGMTGNENGSYYILSTTGVVYALGKNNQKQLGDFTTTDRTSWVRVKKSSATNDYLPTIAWLSPNEHDAYNSAVNALTPSGKLWSWGSNSGNMIGGAVYEGLSDPILMGRGLDVNDRLIAVETGGHTTLVIKQCSKRFGYVGHRVNGSMGDGSNHSVYENTFNFSDTAIINLCGAPTAPNVQDLEVCPGTSSINLNNAFIGSIPIGYTMDWWSTQDRQPGTKINDPSNVGVGIYYAFLIPNEGYCNPLVPSDPVRVFYSDIQLLLHKSSVFVDANNNGRANLGDYITYTLTVKNLGATIVNNLVLNDAIVGISNIQVSPSTLNPGQQASQNFTYYINSSDIQNRGIYNLASVTGETALGCPASKTSVDPNPLSPGDPNYDPTRPDHTFTPLIGRSLLITNPNIYHKVKGN